MLHTFSYQLLQQALYVIYKKQASEGNELWKIKVKLLRKRGKQKAWFMVFFQL